MSAPDDLFTLTLSVKAGSEQVVTDYCVAHLKERGYAISAPNEKWETAREFNKRVGVGKTAIRRALKRPGCPTVLINWGRHFREKRIVQICSNPAFDAFVRKFKQNKKKPNQETSKT